MVDHNDDPELMDAFGEFGVPAHVINKNSQHQVRISVSEYRGVEYIDIRQFFLADGGFRPTKKGVTLSTKLYSELLKGVLELGATLGVLDHELVDQLDKAQ